MDRANIVIIGGGVVGCAVARAVSGRWSDVFLVEQMPKLGMGASTRNSGVIHSGIYYPPGSLKARLCVAGNRMLYEFCAAHGVPHRNCGKLVVAHDARQITDLEHLAANGRANGVEGLRIVDRAAVRAREPHIEARLRWRCPRPASSPPRTCQDAGAHGHGPRREHSHAMPASCGSNRARIRSP